MRIIYFTKSKYYTCKALREMAEKYSVIAVVSKTHDIIAGTELEAICKEKQILTVSNDELYQKIEEGTMPKADVAIVNTYARLIKPSFLNFVSWQCINLHGAILPDQKGFCNMNFGLINGDTEWGATAHYVSEEFDAGDIIEIERFPIDSDRISVKELAERTQFASYRLTMKLLAELENGNVLPRQPQSGGTYYSRADFENAKVIHFDDDPELVRRKVHAFWYPPYEGAYIVIGGQKFQLTLGNAE